MALPKNVDSQLIFYSFFVETGDDSHQGVIQFTDENCIVLGTGIKDYPDLSEFF